MAATARRLDAVRSVAIPAESVAPYLTVVPPIARRTISYVAVLLTGVFALVTLLIGFQAIIAEQQLRIDSVTRELQQARRYHDELRQLRATLITPDQLRQHALLLGMSPGMGSSFAEVPDGVLAEVLAATGNMDPALAEKPSLDFRDPLSAFLAPRSAEGSP